LTFYTPRLNGIASGNWIHGIPDANDNPSGHPRFVDPLRTRIAGRFSRAAFHGKMNHPSGEENDMIVFF